MSVPYKRRIGQQSQRLSLERLECRVVPNVVLIDPPPPPNLPFATNDGLGYNVNQPSSPVPVLTNDLNNPGASWNFASLTVVTPTQFGTLSLDATSGVFLYTPTVIPQPPGAPPLPFQQDSFTYHVRNSLGLQTNTATVTLSPIAGPKIGYLIANPDIGTTDSVQPIVLDILANDELRNDPTRPNSPGEVSDWEFDFSSVKINYPEFNSPVHGSVTFNPATGAVTYTPEFGYIGWDRFVYEVSTLPDQTPAKCIPALTRYLSSSTAARRGFRPIHSAARCLSWTGRMRLTRLPSCREIVGEKSKRSSTA
jgi:hypothetical protein